MAQPVLRPAQPADVPAIVGLIGELAAFENLTHEVHVSADTLHPHLFGEHPVAESLVVEVDTHVVAFALFHTSFSTFLAKPGLYLVDLYVQPAHRGAGLGAMLLKELGKLAVARDYGRVEWSVLDWNVNAIRFYERMGAALLPDWRTCRVTGDALRRLGSA
jgi:GNAT superfamily N-acetyltransferase